MLGMALELISECNVLFENFDLARTEAEMEKKIKQRRGCLIGEKQ